ncbi:hypothetical protein ASF22_02635 [Methylobacterium sp. Leaf87]|uniref:hypothetical protein n=1 Tax=Methylobacterium sp. Leaf87 TaxID=1736243 RepID=UPI0006FA15B6|nr:hypothetical protein [Methylobacterium sp. Leaf87]KQO69524.1 hypothetical protein ASF22_02635 [Methylobacterium sp. Leaf87]
MTYPCLDYRFGSSTGAQPERDAQQYVRTPEEMAEMARAARQHPQNAYMREFYTRQAAETPAGDVIDGEYTVVDVPLLGPPDDQADE